MSISHHQPHIWRNLPGWELLVISSWSPPFTEALYLLYPKISPKKQLRHGIQRSPAHFAQFSGLAWVALAIVAVGTGLRKFQLLNQQARSMAIPPQVPGAVVGTPFGTTDDGKVMWGQHVHGGHADLLATPFWVAWRCLKMFACCSWGKWPTDTNSARGLNVFWGGDRNAWPAAKNVRRPSLRCHLVQLQL